MSDGDAASPGGLLLAFDTSTPLGSVAVSAGTAILARRSLRKQGAHSSDLVPAIHGVLEEGRVGLDELSGVVVGAGPGSFTGVRVAAATAKGLAGALDIPLWAVSSLEAGAAAVGAPCVSLSDGPRVQLAADELTWPRYVLFDARGDRVYAACYHAKDEGLQELVPPHCTTIREVLSGILRPLTLFCGDGADRHAYEIRRAGFTVLPPPLGMPTAGGLLAVMGNRSERAPVGDVGRWTPQYLRPSSAERVHGGSA